MLAAEISQSFGYGVLFIPHKLPLSAFSSSV